MNKIHSGDLRAYAAVAAIITAGAHAGLLYEPQNYSGQDAMILNFDGIRNAGALRAHDGTATQWANLANAARPAVFEFGEDDGSHWQDDGFYFGGLTCARAGATAALGTNATVEVVCDIDIDVLLAASNRIDNVTYRRWPHIIGAATTGDKFNLFFHCDASQNKPLCFKTRGGDRYNQRVWNGKYAIAIENGDKHILVQGADTSDASAWKSTDRTGNIGSFDWLIGSGDVQDNHGMDARFLTGKIKAIRVYNRVLNDTELAANRALDEARYFIGIPVTNVVVATSVPGAEGFEGLGAFAFDDEGYTFTAPESLCVGGETYACAGYTLETWDGSAWGEAETHAGTECALSDATSKVRLTWQWTRLWSRPAAPGLLDVGLYAQESLTMHLDGIRNAGAALPHDMDAAQWTDLATLGEATFSSRAADGSRWLRDGFYFGGCTCATLSRALAEPVDFTLQIVSDANTNMLNAAYYITPTRLAWPALVGITENDTDAFNVFYNTDKEYIVTKIGNTYVGNAIGVNGRMTPSKGGEAWTGRHFTVMKHDTNAANFQTATPADADWHKNFSMSKSIGTRTLVVGGSNGSGSGYLPRYMLGTIKAVRIYNRVLSNAELAANRVLDDARFFGKIPATECVLVASSVPGLDGDQRCGVYQPSGFTFTAPATAQTSSKGYTLAGYTLETWDAVTGEWIDEETSEAASWTSPSGTCWPSRRLTWRWTVSRGLRTAADYDVEDYVSNGLVLHIDGIRNVGADLPHSDLLRAWRDLVSPHASSANVAAVKTNDIASAWQDDGFYFGGKTYGQFANQLTLTNTATVQVTCDVDPAALRAGYVNGNGVSWPHLVSAGNGDKFNVFFHAKDSNDTKTKICFNPTIKRTDLNTWKGRYVTGTRSGKTVKIFQTARSDAGETTSNSSEEDTSIGTQTFRIGSGFSNSKEEGLASRYLTGTINSVRIYDRVLSDDELERNRKVDDARFHGILPVTNVVVEAGANGTGTEAAGAYEVQGAWTFTAPDVKTDGGRTLKLVGYKVSEWDGETGDWGAAVSVKGKSYTHTAGTSPAKVRLVWNWEPACTVLIVR